MDLKEILSIIRRFHQLFEDLEIKDSNFAINEERELLLIIKFIKSGFLEKQLKAIDEIKYLILCCDPNFDSEEHELYFTKKSAYSHPEKLKSFITKNKILEYILGEDFHVELLKRSKAIFRFLSQNGGISKEYFDLLWKHSEDIHENNKKTVFETLIELSKYLSAENLDYIYEKIRSIPLEKFDDCTIDLLKEFILNYSLNKNLGNSLTSFEKSPIFLIFFC